MLQYKSLFVEGAKIAKGMTSLALKTSSAIASKDRILTPEELAIKRLEICEKCPSLSKDSGRCAECGCFIKAKTRINFEECPLEKW